MIPHSHAPCSASLRASRSDGVATMRGKARPSAAMPSSAINEMTGLAQINRDSVEAIIKKLPLVLVLIAGITFSLLFVLTGSAVLPIQALVCNVLSLTAAFGAMVWIFQDGHLGAFGTTPRVSSRGRAAAAIDPRSYSR